MEQHRKNHGLTQWDMWVLEPENYTITNMASGYEIDLDRIQNAADLLAWTFHMSGKDPDIYGGTHYLWELTCAFKAIYSYARRDSWHSREVVDLYIANAGKRRKCTWMAL